MKKSIVLIFISIILLSIPTLAQDQIAKKPNIQVVIHRLLAGKNIETYELFYNPRELKAPYKTRIDGIVEEVQEFLVCSNKGIKAVITRQSKSQYGIGIDMVSGTDDNQNFPELDTRTMFNSLEEGAEILRTGLYSGSGDAYRVTVRATRYHAFQGGFILQCSRQSFPVNIH